MPAKKKATAKPKKTSAKKASPKKNVTAKAASKATARETGRSATPASSSPAAGARRGDRIVIDSVHVGSPAREGEILKIVTRELSVSYQVRWADGHETLITPVAGSAHIVRM
jgi:Domain of unknown function (DUF1918)